MQFAPGTLIAGRYRVDSVLGEGAMGTVLAATHVDMERPVALKFMNTTSLDEALVTRFLREARAVAKLEGAHVVRLFDVARLEDGTPFMVLERLEGEDAGRYLEKKRALDPYEASELVLQASRGLAEAHALGIIHRDIKPQNLFITRTPRGPLVKVLDFGIAKITHDEKQLALTMTRVPVGTPLYMAPEQLRSSRTVDARADVWGLGATLYELVVGDAPFMAASLGEVYLKISEDPAVPPIDRAPIPPDLNAIILRCLAKRPEERYADARELEQALTQFLRAPRQVLAPFQPPPAKPLPVIYNQTEDGPISETAVQWRAGPSDPTPVRPSGQGNAPEHSAPRTVDPIKVIAVSTLRRSLADEPTIPDESRLRRAPTEKTRAPRVEVLSPPPARGEGLLIAAVFFALVLVVGAIAAWLMRDRLGSLFGR